jgi:hypothetical protein
MAKNKISDLRDHLFEELEALKDPEKPLDQELQRAAAISQIAQAIINSAKVEVDMIKALNATAPASPAFFNLAGESRALPPGKELGPHEFGTANGKLRKIASGAEQ